ncbi:chromosome segregation protein SMC [Methyloterricola oryzae]|uniref:chromosome segregation protein SMC n=1 Tax=Methyloterricola oryzae TaxID=1495050 RepID=UPI0005EBB9F3|nr:chromosome segregation protein SMC [Methyloterricola oryzae]
MRLEKIKLAGFKSFVDPTTIPLPSNLVGIVGPNGCGKSNIIDAVRWVMGESSAKHLRGESMADVIFNGSASRKPVGVASVELVFDNTDGDAPGEYAQYRQISIKRQVARDGQSSYFLNGSRCRRRDITDIFLGTGLGARSYAIIEQGTISRLIEAKPDELREVIEEAAGISKYKERRHETEIRMRHTSENLERLQDLRDELAKQIASLQRQARKAEKYTALKAEERSYRTQLLGLRWRKYNDLLQQHHAVLEEGGEAFRRLISEGNGLAEMESAAKEQQAELQRATHGKQGEFYELGAEISRLEQAIKHAHRTREDLLREIDRLRADQGRSLVELESDRERVAAVREELAELQSQQDGRSQEVSAAESRRQGAEQALSAWREAWDAHRSELAETRAQIDLQRTRIRQIEDQQRQQQARRERLQFEHDELQDALMDSEVESLTESLTGAEDELGHLRSRLDVLSESIQSERDRVRTLQTELNGARAELHEMTGRIASLELLQQHAMGKDREGFVDWLAAQGLVAAPRLAESLEVSPGWEAALESVLGDHLQAICVEDAGVYLPRLSEDQPPDNFCLLQMSPADARENSGGLPRLGECVISSWSLEALIGGVYLAEGLADAWTLAQGLASHESVVTPDGTRLGPGWMVIKKPQDSGAGVLLRERELRELRQRRQTLALQTESLETGLAGAEEALHSGEFEREHKQREANRLAAEVTQIKSQLSAALARAEQARKRLQQLEFEMEDLEDQLLQSAEGLAEARTLLERAESVSRDLEAQASGLAERQVLLEEESRNAEAALRSARDGIHALKSRIETLKSTDQLTVKHLERVQTQHDEFHLRLQEASARLAETGDPKDVEQHVLDELLERRLQLERELAELRHRSGEADAHVRGIVESRMRVERELNGVKSRLEQGKLDYQAAELRRQTIQEQFEELGIEAQDVVPDLPDGADEKVWQSRVTELGDEIARLGAINLTAMQEFEEQSERMQFLDQQHHDLTESQTTLQQAIEKIDRECRARFKETFERVNGGIQRMFPKLFGGGQAYLELTERDLLETGVTVMARPPGKRNSSIHLLSGGEKALTAVALVFAIFELNPAPFCLLDEVDAPLDDANVGRFSQLVKEMSERVQFLYISHNKATMEIAQHLAGVTMKEPGVSRIVAVDIDEAVELAAV